MNMRRFIITALLMTMAVGTSIAQIVTYTTERRNDNLNHCTTNRFALDGTKDKTTQLAAVSASYVDGKTKLATTISLVTIGNKDIISLARTVTSKGTEVNGRIAFSNNHDYNVLFLINNTTKEQFKNSDVFGAVAITFPFEISSKLAQDLQYSNITTVSVNTITLNLQEWGLTSGPIYKRIVDNVFAISRGETVPDYTSTSAKAVQLILNPFGVINSEEEGLTGSKIVSLLNQHQGWKANMGSNYYIVVSGYNMTWKGFPIDAYMYAKEGEKFDYGYELSFSSDSEGRKAMNDFCKELADGGIQMEDDEPYADYVYVEKKCKYANKRIHASLTKWKKINIRIYNQF